MIGDSDPIRYVLTFINISIKKEENIPPHVIGEKNYRKKYLQEPGQLKK